MNTHKKLGLRQVAQQDGRSKRDGKAKADKVQTGSKPVRTNTKMAHAAASRENDARPGRSGATSKGSPSLTMAVGDVQFAAIGSARRERTSESWPACWRMPAAPNAYSITGKVKGASLRIPKWVVK